MCPSSGGAPGACARAEQVQRRDAVARLVGDGLDLLVRQRERVRRRLLEPHAGDTRQADPSCAATAPRSRCAARSRRTARPRTAHRPHSPRTGPTARPMRRPSRAAAASRVVAGHQRAHDVDLRRHRVRAHQAVQRVDERHDVAPLRHGHGDLQRSLGLLHEPEAHLRHDAEVRLRENAVDPRTQAVLEQLRSSSPAAIAPMPVRTTSPVGSTTSMPQCASK